MKIWIILIFCLCSKVAVGTFVETRECHSPEVCGKDECCVLAMEKYAIPQCKSKGIAGDWCHVGAVPEDRMLFYPEGIIKDTKGIYPLFCPCADGHSCFKTKCKSEIQAGSIFG